MRPLIELLDVLHVDLHSSPDSAVMDAVQLIVLIVYVQSLDSGSRDCLRAAFSHGISAGFTRDISVLQWTLLKRASSPKL